MKDVFRRAFNPTPEEREADRLLLERLFQDSKDFWVSKGLNDTEVSQLEELEGRETALLRSFESHSGRRSLVENGIITIEQVRQDIEEFKGGVK